VEEVPSQGDVAAPAWDKIDCYSRAVTTSGRQKLCIFCVFIYRVKESLVVGAWKNGALYGCKNTEYMGVCYREEGPLRGRGGMGRGPATHQQVEGAVPT